MSSAAVSENTLDRKYGYTIQEVVKKPVVSGNKGSKVELRKIFGWIIIFLSIILVSQIIFHVLIAPRLSIKNIEIETENGLSLSNNDIFSIAGLKELDYYFSLDVDKVRKNLEAYPPVRSAVVELVFPDTLKIELLKRKPLALSLFEQNGKMLPAYFDEEGVIFNIGISIPELNIPLVSGLIFKDIKPGMKLQRELISFLEELKILKDSSPVLFNQISEIKFERKGETDYEVLLFLVNYRVKVRIGAFIDENLLQYIFLVLDVVSGQGMINNLDELDFRTGNIVYRIKEE